MIWVDKAKKYIWAISARNIDAMAELFADDITFANWGVYVQGKDAAVKANHDHIKLVKETKIEIKNTAYKDKYICIECVLTHAYRFNTVDAFDTANVKPANTSITTSLVYIIEFNDMGKIKSIKTYKLR